jgi:hypothetical protein
MRGLSVSVCALFVAGQGCQKPVVDGGTAALQTTGSGGSTSELSTVGASTTSGAQGSTTVASSSSVATSTGGDDSSGDPDGGSFIVRADALVLPPPCDPRASMACPEGQKCSAAAHPDNPLVLYTGRPWCFPILGDRQIGETCQLGAEIADGLDDCAAGTCVDILDLGDGSGVCLEFCSPPLIGEGPQVCAGSTDFCFRPHCADCLIGFCVPACDPLAQNCAEGTACVEAGSNSQDGFTCRAVALDAPSAGEPCTPGFDCAPGTHCLQADEVGAPECAGEPCCAPLCDQQAVNECPGKDFGEVCRPFYAVPFDPVEEPYGAQYKQLGICALP